MSRLLEASEVAFSYGDGPCVFRGVTVSVEGGQVLGIAGPNGSGKSTLLRVLCGLLKPAAGRVTVDRVALGTMSHRERARVIAFLPQQVSSAFSLTAFEVACLGRYPHAGMFGTLGEADIAVADRCLRDVDAMDLRDRDFLTLSGGERQRVLLASILAQEPSLLLLDEPTAALDIHHEVALFALLRRLAEEGYGIAVVSHDLNLAARFCDRAILLSTDADGPLALGTPREVFTEENLSKAYARTIRVTEHPLTGTPLVTALEKEASP